MGTRVSWKKLVHDADTISYQKDIGEYRIIIEARNYENVWEIVKKYVGSGINFVETYTAQSPHELRSLLKHLRSERDLSRKEIKEITTFRKRDAKVHVRRGWKENNSEKWFFTIGDTFNNFIVIRYGQMVNVDVVMEEQLKYIEEKIITKLYEILALDDTNRGIQQNTYYFSKKTSFDISPEADMDFQFVFE